MARTVKQSWLTLHPAEKASSHGGVVPQVEPPPPSVCVTPLRVNGVVYVTPARVTP